MCCKFTDNLFLPSLKETKLSHRQAYAIRLSWQVISTLAKSNWRRERRGLIF